MAIMKFDFERDLWHTIRIEIESVKSSGKSFVAQHLSMGSNLENQSLKIEMIKASRIFRSHAGERHKNHPVATF